MPLTPAQQAQQRLDAERNAAVGIVRRLTGVESQVQDYRDFKDRMERVVKHVPELEGIDLKKLWRSVDELKSKQESFASQIRLQKSGIYVPGLGESGEQFSLQRAARAIVTKSWTDAGYEHEVFEESRKAILKGPGHIVGVDSQGGYFVPDQVIPEVIGAIYALSQLLSLDGTGTSRVSVLNGLTGIPVTIPKFLGGMLAYWIGEQDRYVESQVGVGNVTMTPKKLGVLTRITDEMRRFSSNGFETMMRNDMTRAAAALIDYTIIYGSGTTNMPLGAVNADGSSRYYAETGSTTPPAGTSNGAELGFNDLDNMRGVVEDLNIPINPSWAWIAHPRYFRRLRQTPTTYYSGQTTGTGYLLGRPMLNDVDLKAVIGDFGASTFMPTKNPPGFTAGLTATTPSDTRFGDVAGANWSEVVFGRWGGVEMAEDGGTGKGFPTDETFIKMRMYGDVGYRVPEAVVVCTDAKMRNVAA